MLSVVLPGVDRKESEIGYDTVIIDFDCILLDSGELLSIW